MLQVERLGDVTRFEMTSAASRIIGYSASAYLVGGVLVDCGFHWRARSMDAILDRERPRGVFITHYHEDHAGNVERVARRGIPIAASTETLAKMRAPGADTGSIAVSRGARRHRFDHSIDARSRATDCELVAAPGHCADHHVVWDESRRYAVRRRPVSRGQGAHRASRRGSASARQDAA